MSDEIETQPAHWLVAIGLVKRPEIRAALPTPGERVAVVGCGTSFYMAQAFALLREASGQGETDAFPASEFLRRTYDRVIAITRTGTTTEVIRLLESLPADLPSTVITTDFGLPVGNVATHTIALDFADERSVVATRFATCALALWRAFLGEDLANAVSDGRIALAAPIPASLATHTQFTFLGAGWRSAIANEAALKLREASQSWAEAYPSMEFRHGPISVTDSNSVVWIFGEAPDGLLDELSSTGCEIVCDGLDPMASLINAQRLAVALAEGKGVDPDAPRQLSRSIVLADSVA